MRWIKISELEKALEDIYKHTNNHMIAINTYSLLRIGVVVILLLSGCSGQGYWATETETQVQITETSTSQTPVFTPKQTSTKPDPENWSKNKKYRYFAGDYYDTVAHSINEYNASVNNGSIEFVYIKENPGNASVNRNETLFILTGYSSMANVYLRDNTSVTKEWIPRRLNITALDPETEDVYWRGHTNYTVMNKYRTGENKYTDYFFRYVQTIEHGPAHPDYEKD